MLKRPKRAHRMPPAITTRHRGRPRLSTLVAGLLRLPSVSKPRTIIVTPRKLRPEFSPSTGQFLAKYPLKRLSSDTIRKMLTNCVMKWEVASKKKTARSQPTNLNGYVNHLNLQFEV
jgi:hypothetical protein